jgi:hypothetical protein
MRSKRRMKHKPEQINPQIRGVQVERGGHESVGEAVKKVGVTE